MTGADGMLGRAVLSLFQGCLAVVGVDLPDGDLTDRRAVDRIFARHRPDWCVHTAAFTDVDGAESNLDRARAVNGDATGHVAAACAGCGAGLTYLSTDYVFAGTADGYDEDAPREPINHYGSTKALGEEAVENSGLMWQIVRTSWLFGSGPKNFVLTIRRLLAERETISVVDDQRGCPTYALDLAAVLLFLVEKGSTGYFHGTNEGACSWYRFAGEIARQTGADPDRIEPCRTSAFPAPARRPACSVLRSHNLERLGCAPRPSWQDALGRYLRTLDDDGAGAG